MFTVSILTPDKIDARVEKAMAKLNCKHLSYNIYYLIRSVDLFAHSFICLPCDILSVSVGELNLMYRLFESCDKEGKGLITVEDFFTKILKIRRSYFGDSICDLIGTFVYFALMYVCST